MADFILSADEFIHLGGGFFFCATIFIFLPLEIFRLIMIKKSYDAK